MYGYSIGTYYLYLETLYFSDTHLVRISGHETFLNSTRRFNLTSRQLWIPNPEQVFQMFLIRVLPVRKANRTR